MTECKRERYEFHALGSREVVGHFDGGDITSDAGGLLLREVEKRSGIIRRFAACFHDRRDPRFTEFTVEELVAQRIYGLDLGYEDLNDHDQLRLLLLPARVHFLRRVSAVCTAEKSRYRCQRRDRG